MERARQTRTAAEPAGRGHLVRDSGQSSVTGVHLASNPLVTVSSSPSLGGNVNGPTVIRVPDWVERPLGRYYVYAANHTGTFIRLCRLHRGAWEGLWGLASERGRRAWRRAPLNRDRSADNSDRPRADQRRYLRRQPGGDVVETRV